MVASGMCAVRGGEASVEEIDRITPAGDFLAMRRALQALRSSRRSC